LLVLLDGMDGDMQIGWGKAKGYGRVRLQLNYDGIFFEDRDTLLKKIGTEKAQQWVQALHDKIKSTVNEAAATGGQA
ncbi:MAG: hypothetical protein D3922_14915, partial [Candidatus Electrothrix sp. AR1]|nr:hypothetical protein [Candidatus Electrothrix sp. AR1]